MGLLDIDENKIKESSKEGINVSNKKHVSLSIGDSLLDEVNRNTQILINNPELVKVPKNILQNEYSKLEKQLKNYFDIEGLDIEVSVPLVNNRLNVMLSLNTSSLLDEQKELVYNSIGTAFADKFDVEFKVREDVGDNLDAADYFELSFSPTDLTKALKILNQKQTSIISASENLISFKLFNTNKDLALATEIDSILKKENLYAGKQEYKTKGIKETNCSRMARCQMFRAWSSSHLQGRYESRGRSDNRNQTVRASTTSLGLRETTFFKEKLDICIKGYDTLFKEAITDKDIAGVKQLINEFFNTFDISKINANVRKAFDNKSLSILLKNNV